MITYIEHIGTNRVSKEIGFIIDACSNLTVNTEKKESLPLETKTGSLASVPTAKIV